MGGEARCASRELGRGVRSQPPYPPIKSRVNPHLSGFPRAYLHKLIKGFGIVDCICSELTYVKLHTTLQEL